MTDENVDKKRLDFLQYLNTVILTAIGIVLVFLCDAVIEVKKGQETTSVELGIIKTKQDANTVNINTLDVRVKSLEVINTSEIKTWVDNNYIRKPQK